MTIYYDGEDQLTEDSRSWVEQAIQTVLQVEGLDQDGEVSVSFVSSDEIQALNREYRQIDSVTDVLSFPQVESLAEAQQLDYLFLGDIVINLERVAAQAIEYGHSQARELMYLTVHSVYHLLGFDHEQPDDKKEMRAREDQVMVQLEVR